MANTKITLNTVDELGEIRASIALLREREKELEGALVKSGDPVHEGSLFRATVSIFDRENVSWKAVAEKLEPSRQLVAAHTSHTTVTQVRVVAKLTAKAAA